MIFFFAWFWRGVGFPIGREAFFWMGGRGAELFDLPGVAFVEKGELFAAASGTFFDLREERIAAIEADIHHVVRRGGNGRARGQ